MEIEKAIVTFTETFLELVKLLIIVRILLSWFPGSLSHPIGQFIHNSTEPIMRLARKVPLRAGMLDFSPIIAFLGIWIIEETLLFYIFPMIFNAPT